MARPTTYSQEILDKAREYLGVYGTLDEVIPSVEGLAVYLDIARSTIYDWESQEEKQEFSDIIEKLLAKQAKELANKGLEGKFNSTITKVILTKHGYSDKTETDITSKGEALGVIYLPQKGNEENK